MQNKFEPNKPAGNIGGRCTVLQQIPRIIVDA